MAVITQKIKDGLNLALNEATILGLDIDELTQTIYVTFHPIAIQSDGSIPKDNRFLFAFRKVGRVASSLTLNKESEAIIFEVGQLADKMSEFKNEQLYGWEFIDNNQEIFKNWQDNKSFDLTIKDDFEKQHTIDLFQEDKYSRKSIDIRIWFDTIEIFDSSLTSFDIQMFIDNGKRGWDKLFNNGWIETEIELGDKLRPQL